jgi:hypothetical protein
MANKWRDFGCPEVLAMKPSKEKKRLITKTKDFGLFITLCLITG